MKQEKSLQEKKNTTDKKSSTKHAKAAQSHHGVNYIVYSNSIFASSTAICLLNLYNIFSVLFWISSDGLPDDIFLMIEILIEFLLICEITIRIAYKLFLKELYDDIKLYHKKQEDTIWYLMMLWIASFPQQILFSILLKHTPGMSTDNISYFLVIKLLRSVPEVYRYATKLEELLFYKTTKTLIFMKCIENIGLIILITHFASSLFMLIQKTHPYVDHSEHEREFNPYGSDTSYFARKNLTDASHIEKYVDSLYWAVSTMTACSFGDVTPRSYSEIITSLFVLVLGASVLAKVFADFASLNYLLNLEKTLTANKFEQVQKFCKINKIPNEIWTKILDYFKIDPETGDPVNKHYLTHSLPQSLQSELNIHLNKEFIERSNLFNFSSPEFIVSLSKKLEPMISMHGDYICRVGEIADEMYFIQRGEVEIFATDGLTKLAILKEGSFFGEIGLIQKTKRTVFVKAKTLVVLQVLKKDDFDALSEVFHAEFNYLKKVAHQRSQVCHPEDIGITRSEMKNRISFHSKLERALSKGVENYRADSVATKPSLSAVLPEKMSQPIAKNFWDSVNHQIKDSHKKDSFWAKLFCKSVIHPQSLFYRLWTALMMICIVYNLIYIPYAISFEYQAQEGDLLPIDITVIVIYFLDIYVQSNTARPRGDKFETNPKIVRQEYFKQDFVVDLISFFPFDYVCSELSIPEVYDSWIRLTRLAKLKRAVMMLNIIKKENIFGGGRLTSLIIAFLFLNHWYACILYLLAKRDHEDNVGWNLFLYADTVTKDKVPLWDQEHYLKYFNFVYWALQISTGGSSMDVLPITVYEKIAQCIGLLFFKVYFAFVGAEVTSIVIAVKIAFTENADKNEGYDKWMENMKLNHKIQDRVRNFNQLKWDKFKGLDENQILSYLPATLRDEVREFMLRDMIEHIDIFSSVDKGFVSSFIKRLKFQILCDGEFVFRKGDIAEDIFFIFEGNVAVMDLEEVNPIATLKKSDMFGEMGVIQLSAGTRSRSIKAVTNVSLAVMSQDDLREICQQFPDVQKKILQKIEDRKLQNQKKEKPKEEPPKLEIPVQPKPEIQPLGSNHQNGPEESKQGCEKEIPKTIDNLLKPKVNINKKIEFKENKLEDSSANLLQDTSIIDEKTIDDDRGTILQENEIPNGKTDKFAKKALLAVEKLLHIDPNNSILPADTSKEILIKQTPTFSDPTIESPELKDGKTNEVNVNLDLKKLADAPNKKDTSSSDSSTKVSQPENKVQPEPSVALQDNLLPKKNSVLNKKFVRTVRLIKLISNLGKKRAVRKFTELFMRTRGFTLTIVSLYNIIFLPLYIGLQTIEFKGVFLALEIISIFFYGLDAIIKVIRHFVEDFYRDKIDEDKLETLTIEELKQGRKKKSKLWFMLGLFLSVLYSIPFALIFEYSHIHNRFLNLGLVLLQLIRLLGFDQLLWIFSLKFFRTRVGLANILTSVIIFTLFNHFAGCFHMFVGYTIGHHDMEETWLTKLPAPQFEWPHNEIEHYVSDSETLYISALYWAYVTTMNLGVGDIISVGLYEKIWCAIIMIIAAFLFVFLFGNLVSLVDDIVPQYQKAYEESFRHVLEYTKSKEYEKYSEKINKYYDYIWVSNKGFDEIALLKELPNLLKVDIQLDRYAKTIRESRFFIDKSGQINESIVRYFFKKCQYLIAMTDDIIINEGQETEDVYFILEGEIVGFDHEADTMKRLKVGGYFGGYIPTMVQFYEFKASTISKLAVMKGKNFKFLCEAYPEWIEHVRMMNAAYRSVVGLQRKVREYLKKKKENPPREDTVEAQMLELEKKMSPDLEPSEDNSPQLKPQQNEDRKDLPSSINDLNRSKSKGRKTMKFFSVLFNKEAKNLLRVKKFFIKPASKHRIIIEAVHFFMILYSAFALPVLVGFELTLSGFSLAMEYFILIESIVYSSSQFRIGVYEAGILTVDFKTILKSYIKRGFYNELIAFIPFNLIFFWAGATHPVWLISILRLNRLAQLTRISGIVGIFCSINPKIIKILALGKPIFLLTFIWHFTSLSWMWYNLLEKEEDLEEYWLGSLELGRKSIFQQYIYCLHFLMNIATTTGYPEQIAYNNAERVIYILYINVGIGLFALAFGMMVESSKALPEKYQEIFEVVCQLENMLAKRNASSLKKKLELYYSYIVENDTKSLERFEENEIPTNLLKDFTHEQAKLIMHHPMFEGVDQKSFYIELFDHIEHHLYMPGDYMINKGDYGQGIYFIVSGNVLCYSSNERVVLLNLTEGDWFGEKSLLFLTKNTQTFVAETFCTCFFISKSNFDKILLKFPHISHKISEKLQERLNNLQPDEKMVKDLDLITHEKAKSLRSSEERAEFERVLFAMEVPVDEQDGSKSPKSRVKKVNGALNLRKIQLINGSEVDINEYVEEDDEKIDDEYVAEDEFSELHDDFKKTSLRNKGQQLQRRFSRIVIGSEKSLSKTGGFKIKWGINLN